MIFFLHQPFFCAAAGAGAGAGALVGAGVAAGAGAGGAGVGIFIVGIDGGDPVGKSIFCVVHFSVENLGGVIVVQVPVVHFWVVHVPVVHFCVVHVPVVHF